MDAPRINCERSRKQATAVCIFAYALISKLIYSFWPVPERTDPNTSFALCGSMALSLIYMYLLTKVKGRWLDFLFLSSLNLLCFIWIEHFVNSSKLSLVQALNEAPIRTVIPVICLLIGGNGMGSFFCGIICLYYMRGRDGSLDFVETLACVSDLITVLSIIICHNRNQEQVYEILQRKCLSEEKANRAKNVFVAKMSHDLRTPLNGLLGFLEELREMKRPQLLAELDEYLKVIYLCAKNLERLIQDLLDVSLGKIHLVPEVFDSFQCFHSMAMMLNKLAIKKKISFSFRLSETFPQYLKGDWARIQQIFTNLVNNAIKFTGENGLVEVFLQHQICSDERVRVDFKVRDTGIGIPECHTNDVFKKFFQCRNKDAEQGSGLGLFISEQLITSMGGKISLSSKEGEGTTFFGHFFVELGESKPKEEKEVDLSGLKVLVAEDNPINMKLITRILESLGVSFLVAWNGIEAIEQVEKHEEELELILMDVQMPKLDGIQAAARIRNLTKKYIPIVAVTAGVTESEVGVLLQSGIDSYISKPLNKEKLKRELEKWKKMVRLE